MRLIALPVGASKRTGTALSKQDSLGSEDFDDGRMMPEGSNLGPAIAQPYPPRLDPPRRRRSASEHR